MLQSKQVAARKPLPEPITAVNPVEVYGEYVVPAGGIPVNSIIEMVGIPAYTVPSGWKLVCDDLDSNGAPAITLTEAVQAPAGHLPQPPDTRQWLADLKRSYTTHEQHSLHSNTGTSSSLPTRQCPC